MKKFNAVIVGRNIKSVNSISFVLKDFENIMVRNVFANMEAVYGYEKEENIDILFWDFDEENGSLEKQIKKINTDMKGTKFICLSSNPEDVLNAFQFGAVDFIQKPVSSDHLLKGIKKAKYLMNAAIGLNERRGRTNGPIKYIIVSSLKDVMILPVDSIVYMESEGRYTLIYKRDGEIIVSSKNLGFYDELLKQNNFFRIHHSFLVNVDLSLKIEKGDGVYLHVVNNKFLPISKRKVEAFYSFLKTIG
tara:strand:- start:1023 stop:1766 length:744 start_codon:yes stop_codon:yes gene_type:complete